MQPWPSQYLETAIMLLNPINFVEQKISFHQLAKKQLAKDDFSSVSKKMICYQSHLINIKLKTLTSVTNCLTVIRAIFSWMTPKFRIFCPN